MSSTKKVLVIPKSSSGLDARDEEHAEAKYIPTEAEERLLKKLAELKEQHAKELKEAKAQARREAFAAKKPELKISNKGCVQINGIRRFPITLYKNEWEKIFEIIPEIKEFIKTNSDKLASI